MAEHLRTLGAIEHPPEDNTATPSGGWKDYAGASSLVDHERLDLRLGLPPAVTSNIQMIVLQSSGQQLFFAPNGIFVMERRRIGLVPLRDLVLDYSEVEYADVEPPSDATVVGTTWMHPNKDGSPDLRFRQNPQVRICLFGAITIRSTNGFCALIYSSIRAIAKEFVDSFKLWQLLLVAGSEEFAPSNAPSPVGDAPSNLALPEPATDGHQIDVQ